MTVGEPTKEEAVEILFGLRDRYEAHHKATITDEAIRAAVELSDRYISDRFCRTRRSTLWTRRRAACASRHL